MGGPAPFLGALKYSSSDFAHRTPRSGIAFVDLSLPAGSAAAGVPNVPSSTEARTARKISARRVEQRIAISFPALPVNGFLLGSCPTVLIGQPLAKAASPVFQILSDTRHGVQLTGGKSP